MDKFNIVSNYILQHWAVLEAVLRHSFDVCWLWVKVYCSYFAFFMLLLAPWWVPTGSKYKVETKAATIICVLVALYVFCNSPLSNYLTA